MAARKGIPVICQKPIAANLHDAEEMVAVCKNAGVPLFIHENYRWRRGLREVKKVLDSGRIGKPFRGRVECSCSFPVFDNQPFLKDLQRFILTDIGSHVLDSARFLFGEAFSLYCQTRRIHPDIKGEDVATVMMRMGGDVSVVCEMSYASVTEHERFPEMFVFVEAERGSVWLKTDHWLSVTTAEGVQSRRVPPPRFSWADPAYDVTHASIVPCNADILGALRGETPAETTGEDNLKTARLFFGAYDSAEKDEVLHLQDPET
jgi:predicted dehydrogenase